jgi:HSP20 family molecular chaperone IbpA
VAADKVEAEFHGGVLKVTIPKAEESKPKRIEVKTESPTITSPTM